MSLKSHDDVTHNVAGFHAVPTSSTTCKVFITCLKGRYRGQRHYSPPIIKTSNTIASYKMLIFAEVIVLLNCIRNFEPQGEKTVSK